MGIENKIFNKVVSENKESEIFEYKQRGYSQISPEARKKFFSERIKKLGYSFRTGGKDTNVLISGAHAVDLIELKGVKVSQEDIELLNENSEHKKPRYKKSKEGNLLIGKQYFNAGQRNKGTFMADTNVSSVCIELQDLSEEENDKKTSSLVI